VVVLNNLEDWDRRTKSKLPAFSFLNEEEEGYQLISPHASQVASGRCRRRKEGEGEGEGRSPTTSEGLSECPVFVLPSFLIVYISWIHKLANQFARI